MTDGGQSVPYSVGDIKDRQLDAWGVGGIKMPMYELMRMQEKCSRNLRVEYR